jgi:tryptophan synthase alpha chain
LSEAGIAARWRVLAGAGRAALIPFFTAGYPSAAASLAALRGAADAGADLVEVGVPFSDPLADGPTIQRATHAALAGGMTAAGALALVREAALPIPVVLMTYLNPVRAYGARRFAADARAAGAAGVLLTDAPAGADPETEGAIAQAGLDLIRLVAPTTTDARLGEAVGGGSGFVYLITRLGVTGVRDTVPSDLAAQVARVRRATPLPVAAGFGIGTPAQAAAAARAADGVVVGSAIVERLGEAGVAGALALVGALARAVREARG